jgi:hypothetical protein
MKARLLFEVLFLDRAREIGAQTFQTSSHVRDRAATTCWSRVCMSSEITGDLARTLIHTRCLVRFQLRCDLFVECSVKDL